MPAWKKGESGNPKGRAPKNRTLTDILEKAGNAKHDYGGSPITAKHLVANLLWQAAVEGQVIFPDGTILRLGVEDWIGVNKFIYQHIDGPPKAELDITSAGEQLFIKMDQ
jgi:hypothetical protein